jgi:hypothetical protein
VYLGLGRELKSPAATEAIVAQFSAEYVGSEKEYSVVVCGMDDRKHQMAWLGSVVCRREHQPQPDHIPIQHPIQRLTLSD